MFHSCFIACAFGIGSVRVGTRLYKLKFPANVPVQNDFDRTVYAIINVLYP